MFYLAKHFENKTMFYLVKRFTEQNNVLPGKTTDLDYSQDIDYSHDEYSHDDYSQNGGGVGYPDPGPPYGIFEITYPAHPVGIFKIIIYIDNSFRF